MNELDALAADVANVARQLREYARAEVLTRNEERALNTAAETCALVARSLREGWGETAEPVALA